MTKLLNADFSRLWKNKVFWLGVATMVIWPVLVLIVTYRTSLAVPNHSHVLDGFFFQYGPVIGGFVAIFTSLFLGTDYSDGTIRNKITVGHLRYSIYLSNLIVSAVASILMNAAWILTMITVGTSLFGWFSSSITSILMYLCVTIFMILAFAAIFTFIAMLNQSKANSAVVALLVFLAILFLASYLNNRLHEPEMYSPGIVISSGTVELSEPTRNPNYVYGSKRKLFEFFVDFLPTGQGILMSYMGATHLVLMPLYSLVITVMMTITGMLCFRRKDLK